MKKSTKTKVKVVVVALALLLCLALSIGVAGAWYEARRTATGTINMDKGIIIEYTGFHHETADTDNIWQKDEVDFQLFSTTSAVPGTEVVLEPNTTINAATGSVDFYARFKLDYKFYTDLDGAAEATGINPTDVLVPSDSFINSAWVESGDGFYYLASGTTLTELTPNGTPAAFFADGAKYTINTNIGGEGFGYQVDADTKIVRADVILTLEVTQVGTPWSINGTGGSNEPEEIVEDFTTTNNVLQNASGQVLSHEEIDIVEGETYQIVNKENNVGLQYQFGLTSASTLSATIDPNEVDGTATVVGYAGDITDVVIPEYIILGGKTYEVVGVNDGVFSDCSSLTRLVIPDSVTSLGAISGCENLKEIVIGDGVTNLSRGSLSDNTALETLVMGSGITSFTNRVCYGCESLITITIKAATPPNAGSSAFPPNLTTIYVPAESVDAYKAANVWNGYNIQPIE